MHPESHQNRKSVRLPGFDYSAPGGYYLTIVTQGRAHLFGEIQNGEMQLSEAGEISAACWRAIPEHFPQAELGAFVVMPNHVHGSIILHELPGGEASENGAAILSPRGNGLATESSPTVGATDPVARATTWVAPTARGPKRGSIGAIIGAYKMAVTRQIVQRFGGAPLIWQRNYYEHVIRAERDHQNIHNYIVNNPFNWETDKENQQ